MFTYKSIDIEHDKGYPFGGYNKSKTTKLKDPISIIYNNIDQGDRLPGPGQYNLPGSFNTNIKERLAESNVGQLNMIEMLRINRSSNFKSKTKRLYELRQNEEMPGVGDYMIPRYMEDSPNSNAKNYYRHGKRQPAPFMNKSKR